MNDYVKSIVYENETREVFIKFLDFLEGCSKDMTVKNLIENLDNGATRSYLLEKIEEVLKKYND